MGLTLTADFHIHSKYTAGTDKSISLEKIVEIAKIKGIQLLGTGDALHPVWRNELKSKLKRGNDIYEYDGIYFIPSVEIKLKTYVHGVLLLPTLDDFDELFNNLKKYGKLEKIGVPNLYLDGDNFLNLLDNFEYLFFPAHVFVPWQSLYGKYNSIKEFFKETSNKINAVELGLSADPPLADKVPELKCKVFLTNSDSHSYWYIGKEFNLLKDLYDISFKEIVKSIVNNRVINYTLPSQLGKYHLTACRKCHTFYTYEDAKALKWRCFYCNDKIYMGVKDRIEKELSRNFSSEECDKKRLERNFTYHIPLLTLLTELLGFREDEAKTFYVNLLKRLNITEIELLHNIDLEKLELNDEIKNLIQAFRNKNFYIIPGGGGIHGKLSKIPQELKFFKYPYRRLLDFR